MNLPLKGHSNGKERIPEFYVIDSKERKENVYETFLIKLNRVLPALFPQPFGLRSREKLEQVCCCSLGLLLGLCLLFFSHRYLLLLVSFLFFFFFSSYCCSLFCLGFLLVWFRITVREGGQEEADNEEVDRNFWGIDRPSRFESFRPRLGLFSFLFYFISIGPNVH